MQEEITGKPAQAEQKLYIAPTSLIRGEPLVPSSKYYTLRYLLSATLAEGESIVSFPAISDDSDVLFCGCQALGAELTWHDKQLGPNPSRQRRDRAAEPRHFANDASASSATHSGEVEGVRATRSGNMQGESELHVCGAGRPRSLDPITINVGNAGAVLRLLLGVAALLPEVTFITDHPHSLGKRPNRELLEALTSLGAICEGTGPEGYLPITIRGGNLHGGRVSISGARSSQYLSSLLFLAPLIGEEGAMMDFNKIIGQPLADPSAVARHPAWGAGNRGMMKRGDQSAPTEIVVVDRLKSQPLIHVTLKVLKEAGIVIEYDETLRHFSIAPGQHYRPGHYVVPGDYPSAAALLAACAVTPDPASEVRLSRLRPGEEDGEALLSALKAMGADLRIDGETITLRGGRRLRGIEMDGDQAIDCVPVLVALACFAQGQSVFYNIETLHYKESDRINDLCAELRRAGCAVTPQEDAIIVQGRPQGIEGGVTVDAHSDHRLLMALAIVGLRSRRGLTLSGVEHISKSYPQFFEELQRLGVEVRYL